MKRHIALLAAGIFMAAGVTFLQVSPGQTGGVSTSSSAISSTSIGTASTSSLKVGSSLTPSTSPSTSTSTVKSIKPSIGSSGEDD